MQRIFRSRGLIAVLSATLILQAIGLAPGISATKPATTLAAACTDTFTRTVADGWGESELNGNDWMLGPEFTGGSAVEAPPSYFSVDGSRARFSGPLAQADRSVYVQSISTRPVEVLARVRMIWSFETRDPTRMSVGIGSEPGAIVDNDVGQGAKITFRPILHSSTTETRTWRLFAASITHSGSNTGAQFSAITATTPLADDSATATWDLWVRVRVEDELAKFKIWKFGTSEPGFLSVFELPAGSPSIAPSVIGFWMLSQAGAASQSRIEVDSVAVAPGECHPEPPEPPDEPPPDETEHNPPHRNQEATGDPVSTYTGAFSDYHVDAAIPGRGPMINFARAYNSNDSRVTSLGPGWTHSYNVRLVSPGDGTEDLVLVGPLGRSDRYAWTGSAFAPPAGVRRELVRNPDGTYTSTEKDQSVSTFDAFGRLTQVRDRYGNSSALTYNAAGQLATISDPGGRGNLTLAYTGDRLTSVSDWASPARVVGYEYDADGRLWKITDREGKVTTFSYDGTTHRITTITDKRGNIVLTNTYDAQGRVATQQDARGLVTGEETTFAYVVNPDGTRQTTVTAPPTSFEPSFSPALTDTYDANGWLVQRATQASSTESLTESFTYDADGDRTSATDARGNRTDFCYDVSYAGASIAGSEGNLTRRIDHAPSTGADRPVSLIAYDAQDNVTQTVAPEGVPSGGTVSCSTDLSAIDPAHAIDFTYDSSGVTLLSSVTRATDPELGLRSSTTKFEYGDAVNPGLITRVIPPRGNTGPSPDYTYATTLTYYTTGSNAGMLKDSTDPLGNRTSFAYDAVGRLTSTVDPLGNATGGVPAEHTTTLSYDKEDRLRIRTLPPPEPGGAGLTEEMRYDAAGNPVVRIDANGQVTAFAYDARNSLDVVTESALTWTDPAAPPATVIVTEYDHDAGGNLIRITRAAGDAQYERVTDYAYDGRGLLRTETQYPAWPSTTGPLVTASTYDSNGNPLSATDALGQTTTFTHDALNRPTGIDYSDAGTPDVAYAYDANGNRTSITDGTGTTTYDVDEAGRLVSVTSPGPTTVGYRYDLDGNRTKLIYPDATAVTYAWNKGGQLASLLDWASRPVSYAYAPDGLVRTATNPDGSVASYSYDNARRLVDILHTGPSNGVLDRFAYTLDAAGNVTDVANGSLDPQFARPDGFVSSDGSWSGTYASIDEVTANDVDFLASPSGPTTSNYYEVSLSDVSAPHSLAGITVRYRYAKSGNNSGKVTNLTVELRQGSTVIASQAHANIPGVAGSGWQAGSFTLTTAQANAITDFVDLRLRFRPSSSGGGQSRSAQVSWAELELASAGDPASLISYSYDRLDRLTGVEDAGGSTSYAYDPVGNRLTAGATAFTFDRADRITAAGATSITVNANGNLTAKGADSFGFDQANRLTSVTAGGITETYAYDGDGTRVSRQVGSDPTVDYVSDVAGGLPVTIDDGTRKYVYGLGLAYAVSGSSVEVYYADHLGSVRSLTDGAGAVIATYQTDAWGVPTQTTGGSSQPFGYTGEPTDATGLSYLRARYYDPELGRFLSRDTWAGGLSAPQSLNSYSYVTNNPVRYTDPSGHCGVDLVADVGFSLFSLGQVIFGPEKERAENLGYLGLDIGGIFIPCGAGMGTISRTVRATTKAMNLPSWRSVPIDMAHVLGRHTQAGAQWTPAKTFFSDMMSPQAIEAAVREAYRTGARVRAHADTIVIRGSGGGYTIELWLNRATEIIETAYPVP